MQQSNTLFRGCMWMLKRRIVCICSVHTDVCAKQHEQEKLCDDV